MVAIPPTAVKMLEMVTTLCRTMEQIQKLYGDRIDRLEDHFRGNGDSLITRVRLLASDVERLDDRLTQQLANEGERRGTAADHAEERLQQQLQALEERRITAATAIEERLQRQLDGYGNELARVKKSLDEERSRKWDVLKILLAWVLGAGITVLVQIILRK
jgi:hypothetical protein